MLGPVINSTYLRAVSSSSVPKPCSIVTTLTGTYRIYPISCPVPFGAVLFDSGFNCTSKLPTINQSLRFEISHSGACDQWLKLLEQYLDTTHLVEYWSTSFRQRYYQYAHFYYHYHFINLIIIMTYGVVALPRQHSALEARHQTARPGARPPATPSPRSLAVPRLGKAIRLERHPPAAL